MAEPTRADAQMYARVFVGHGEGALILEDLIARFYDRPSYTKGALDGARETDYREGRRAVIQFILRRVGQVQRGEEDPNVEA